jgi:2-polyprenyl-6-methoxyphenol hydroxylase-like FAD-dependent oxidoreductase
MMPVVVAGAGIGGLSAALALAQKGFEVHVFERAKEIREIGAGIQLGPNAFDAFAHLGVSEPMEAIVFEPRSISLIDSITGAQICRQNLGYSFVRRFGRPYRVAYRADVQRVLLDAVRLQPGIRIHLGEGIRAYSQEPRELVVFGDRQVALSAQALIGADGLWSEIRQSILGDGPPAPHGHVAYRAVLASKELSDTLATDDVQIWVGPGHHLVCYKLRRGELFNVVAIVQSSKYREGWDCEPDIEELRSGFAGTCGQIGKILEHLQLSRMWVLCDRPASRGWSRGAVTLLGDAAHPALPYLAQGACMAIEDAICLAEQFSQYPLDLTAACGEYEKSRFERTRRVQEAAREMGRMNHASGEAREARNRALSARDPDDHESNAWLFDGPKAVSGRPGQSFFGPLR